MFRKIISKKPIVNSANPEGVECETQ